MSGANGNDDEPNGIIGELARIGLNNPLSSAIGLLTLIVILALFVIKTNLRTDQTVIVSVVLLFMSVLTIGGLQFASNLKPGQMKAIFYYPVRALVWVATACVSIVLISFTFSMLDLPWLKSIAERIVGSTAVPDEGDQPPPTRPDVAGLDLDAPAEAPQTVPGSGDVADAPPGTPVVGPSPAAAAGEAIPSTGVAGPPPSTAAPADAPEPPNVPETRGFEITGRVECQPAQLFGADRERKSEPVTYTAPPGFKIVNESVSSVRVHDMSAVNGSIGSPEISEDRARLTVMIGCRGGNIGEGRGWQTVRIEGTIRRE